MSFWAASMSKAPIWWTTWRQILHFWLCVAESTNLWKSLLGLHAYSSKRPCANMCCEMKETQKQELVWHTKRFHSSKRLWLWKIFTLSARQKFTLYSRHHLWLKNLESRRQWSELVQSHVTFCPIINIFIMLRPTRLIRPERSDLESFHLQTPVWLVSRNCTHFGVDSWMK